MLRLTFSSKLDWDSYTVSIAKTACKKIGALIRSMKFLSPGVALYLYKSTARHCMECCCHVWGVAPSCYLELLDKLQKQICRTVVPSLAASLEPLGHRQSVASLSLFSRYYFNITDVLQNWPALKFEHFLPLQIKWRGNYMKIHFASAFPLQYFCRGWQDFTLRASVFTLGTLAKASVRVKLVKLLTLLHISPKIRSIMCTIIVVKILLHNYCYMQCNVLFSHIYLLL